MRRAIRVVFVGAAVLVAGALAVGVQYPQVRDRRDASDLEPGLLQVDPVARGAVSLGNGVYVQVGSGGLTILRRNHEVWRGVDRGSPVTAGIGDLRWRGAGAGAAAGGGQDGVLRVREDVRQVLGNLRLTGRRLDATSVVYTGRVFAGDYRSRGALPVTLTVTRRERDSRVLLDVQVPGADVVALHEYRRPGYTYRGLGAQTASDRLQDGRYPILTRAQGVGRGEQPLTAWQDLTRGASGGDRATTPAAVPAYLSSVGSGLALDSSAYAVVDLRHDGRVDTSVWSDRLQARMYDGTPEQMLAQHGVDAGPAPAPPSWSSSGAIVGVRGSVERVEQAVTALTGAQASVAAVLVRDGGQRRRYAGWSGLVDRLRERDVRVMTTVSPALALSPRPGGPDDEPTLLARARNEGWLVVGPSGSPLPVPVADVDAGTVPGALVDLTNPVAAQWYQDVLAQRMRSEGLSGWYALGGDELPMDARLAHGRAIDEHNIWPRRWAALTRAACESSGTPQCLLLQDSADERTAALTGVLSLGDQVGSWSAQDGLASVLPATFNAGLSGLTLAHSGVGGWSMPTVPLWPDPRRSDELLARWAELEAFGPLLRTDEGEHPQKSPQVWDSPQRLAAFARVTRLFAATADYRRTAIADAVATGMPVVRPVWVDRPELRQATTDGELLFGDSLLVSPVLEEGVRRATVGLPPGTWVELWSGRRHVVPEPATAPAESEAVSPPAQQVELGAPLGRPVVLYRAGDPDVARLPALLRSAGLLP